MDRSGELMLTSRRRTLGIALVDRNAYPAALRGNPPNGSVVRGKDDAGDFRSVGGAMGMVPQPALFDFRRHQIGMSPIDRGVQDGDGDRRVAFCLRPERRQAVNQSRGGPQSPQAAGDFAARFGGQRRHVRSRWARAAVRNLRGPPGQTRVRVEIARVNAAFDRLNATLASHDCRFGRLLAADRRSNGSRTASGHVPGTDTRTIWIAAGEIIIAVASTLHLIAVAAAAQPAARVGGAAKSTSRIRIARAHFKEEINP
jgi:hypothetical protein